MVTLHTIVSVHAVGTNCQILLSPHLRRPNGREYDLSLKWDAMDRLVALADLRERVLNDGYRGLRVAVEDERPVALSLPS